MGEGAEKPRNEVTPTAGDQPIPWGTAAWPRSATTTALEAVLLRATYKEPPRGETTQSTVNVAPYGTDRPYRRKIRARIAAGAEE